MDGLRGLAILLVVWYHTWLITWLSADVTVFGKTLNFNVFAETGFAGVYLFFFISGFCLFYPYAQSMFDGRPLQPISVFAYRRLLKIVPSYYVGIALWVALGFASFTSFGDAVRQVLSHLFFVQTFWDETYGGINGVLWSLAIEVQFYVFFPVLCWAFMRKPLVVFAGTLLAANLYRLVAVHQPNVAHIIEQLPGAIDVFTAGMLSAWAYRLIAVRFPAMAGRRMVWTAIAAAGMLCLFLSLENLFLRRHDDQWILTWNVYGVPTVALSLIPTTVGSLFAYRSWQTALANPVLLGLSFISYNLYLWHQIVATWLVRQHLLNFVPSDPSNSDVNRLIFFLVATSLGLGVAWMFTVVLEQPLLRRRPFQGFVERLSIASVGSANPTALTFPALKRAFATSSLGVDLPLPSSFRYGPVHETADSSRTFVLKNDLDTQERQAGSANEGAPLTAETVLLQPATARSLRERKARSQRLQLAAIAVAAALLRRIMPFLRRHAELFVVVGLAYTIGLLSSHFRSTDFNNYTRLADAMRHGHMWIDYPGRWLDAIEYKGKHYVVDGPFPALLMFPTVLLYGASANQTSIALLVTAFCIGLAYRLLRAMHVARVPRLMLLLFLFAGTDMWWCAELGDVWFMAHLCAMTAVFAAFLELVGKRRGWVLGLCAIAAFFSRNVEVFAIGFIAYAMYTGDFARAAIMDRGEPPPTDIDARRGFISFGSILSLGVLLWIGYNEASWGTLVDIGHTVYFHQDSWGQKDGSPFRLIYVPYQIYSYFFRAPIFVEWLQQAQWPVLKVDTNGVALTFTSPALILSLLAKRPSRLVAALWLTTAAVAGPDFLYYLNGWYQFGMRHALDFEPYLFVLMALAVRDRMPRWGIVLCLYSAVVGAWGVWWWNTFMRTGG